jgi:hypothetical protein
LLEYASVLINFKSAWSPPHAGDTQKLWKCCCTSSTCGTAAYKKGSSPGVNRTPETIAADIFLFIDVTLRMQKRTMLLVAVEYINHSNRISFNLLTLFFKMTPAATIATTAAATASIHKLDTFIPVFWFPLAFESFAESSSTLSSQSSSWLSSVVDELDELLPDGFLGGLGLGLAVHISHLL